VTVRIFDLKGREIKTLYSGLCLGPSRAVWDGRDQDGARVPAGVYICHVQSRERDRAGGGDAAIPVVVGKKLD
jgi:flagellar hook assembly protein FlgD